MGWGWSTGWTGATTGNWNTQWDLFQQQALQNQASNYGPPILGQAMPPVPEKPKASGPETALAWLDRRVNEIRVAL